MNPPSHKSFGPVIEKVNRLDACDPRIATRYIDVLMAGLANMLLTSHDYTLMERFQLAAWLEWKRGEFKRQAES
jgi:hypothetical protein